MQKITQDCNRNDPFLKRACDTANRNNPEGAVAVIRSSGRDERGNRLAAVWITNGRYRSPGSGRPMRFYPEAKKAAQRKPGKKKPAGQKADRKSRSGQGRKSSKGKQ